MKIVIHLCTALLRAVGLLLAGAGASPARGAHADKLGYPDAMKLGSWHVDPYRTGNYFSWTKRD